MTGLRRIEANAHGVVSRHGRFLNAQGHRLGNNVARFQAGQRRRPAIKLGCDLRRVRARKVDEGGQRRGLAGARRGHLAGANLPVQGQADGLAGGNGRFPSRQHIPHQFKRPMKISRHRHKSFWARKSLTQRVNLAWRLDPFSDEQTAVYHPQFFRRNVG